jgi:hypothetical protein
VSKADVRRKKLKSPGNWWLSEKNSKLIQGTQHHPILGKATAGLPGSPKPPFTLLCKTGNLCSGRLAVGALGFQEKLVN